MAAALNAALSTEGSEDSSEVEDAYDGTPTFGDLHLGICTTGDSSFGDWKIHIWGFVQLGIWKKILLGILKNNRHLGIEKYIWGYTFGDAKKYN
jgi:hypothetical protein